MKIQSVPNSYSHSSSNNREPVIRRTSISAQDTLTSGQLRPSLIARVFHCFASLWNSLASLFSREVYTVPNLENVAFLFPQNEIDTMRAQYQKLGASKWEEMLSTDEDKVFYGRVDDEFPTSIANIEKNAFPLIDKYLGSRMDSRMFLEIHKAACFDLPTSKRGVFRDDKAIGCKYTLGKSVWQEDLDEFASSGYGTYKIKEGKCHLVFDKRSKEEIAKLVDRFFNEFYKEMVNHRTLSQEQKVHQIAKLAQALYWLHPPFDGRKRTVLLTIQKLSTEYLGHPGIFKNIHYLPMRSLKKLEQDILQAFTNWEARAIK